MKPLRLRAQVVLAAGFIQLYVLGVGASYWLQVRAHTRLETQLHESLLVLTRLPELRDGLRKVDEGAERYLLSGGDPVWLYQRDRAVAKVHEILDGLSEQTTNPRNRALFNQIDHRLTEYLATIGPWTQPRHAGHLSPWEAVRLTRLGAALQSAANPLSDLAEEDAKRLRARSLDLARISRLTAELIVLAGAVAAVLMALFLSRYLIGPVADLRDYARSWALGNAWAFRFSRASPEVLDLCDAMREMSNRLNQQFAHEEELGRLKSRLVSMASHEFNNALSVLGGTVHLLREGEPAPPSGPRAEHYIILETNLRSLGLATNNLLNLGRVESGAFAVRPRRADIVHALSEAAKALQPIYQRKNIAFTLKLPPDPPPALADPEAVLLAVTNLIGNAVKYTPEGGQVSAGVIEEAPDRVRVFVSDTGIGIAPEDRERVLSAGHRTQEGRRVASGFGVGLTLVRSVLDAHGIALEMESAPGRGSRFSFVLPRWTAPVSGDLLG